MSEPEFLKAGFETPAMELVRTPALQATRLECCGVDPGAHGNHWAPGLLGTDCFQHLGDVGQSIAGSVHVDMLLVQSRPLALDCPLIIQGHTAQVMEAPRGPVARMVFTFTDPGGVTPFRVEIGVMMPEADKVGGQPPPRSPSALPQDARDGFTKCGSRQLEPQHVQAYGGARNPIHLDPDFALSRGFRAPIAHGVMTAVYMLGALDSPAAPANLEVSFRFRRPVFWDDAMELWAEDKPAGEAAGHVKRFRSLSDAAKVTAEMDVARADYL